MRPIVLPIAVVFTLIGIFTQPFVGFGQEDGQFFEPGTTPTFNLTDVCVGKIMSNDNGESIIHLRTPRYRPTTQTKTFEVTRMIPEERVRIVMIDGRAVEQAFTVFVPVVETIERQVSILEPNGMTEMEILLEQVEARNIEGELLSVDELTERLEMPQHMIRLSSPWTEDNPIGTYYLSVLARNTLFIYIRE